MHILVTGGAGYIGSAVVSCLQGHTVTVIDNLAKGRRSLLSDEVAFINLDLHDREGLLRVFQEHRFDAVMHFAAAKDAGESMKRLSPYSDNITCFANLLHCMDVVGCKKLIFSSSAAVYGMPETEVITEEHPCNPINYYGFSKLTCEQMLAWYVKLRGFVGVSLRYFNVAGDMLGYIDPDAKNVFPILGEVLSGKRKEFTVFGDDYLTPDGTCIRDYVHIADLADAHVRALDCATSETFNLGTGRGYSVLALVAAFSKEAGKQIPYVIASRREGDPARLVCSCEKALKVLGWKPMRSLQEMVKSTVGVYKD